jgi:hypothetical protein
LANGLTLVERKKSLVESANDSSAGGFGGWDSVMGKTKLDESVIHPDISLPTLRPIETSSD